MGHPMTDRAPSFGHLSSVNSTSGASLRRSARPALLRVRPPIYWNTAANEGAAEGIKDDAVTSPEAWS
jgi:hypothetical protein